MKKCFLAFLIIIICLFVTCIPAQAAAQAVWSIEWNSDNSINETVVINDYDAQIEDNEWKTFRSDQELRLTRHIKNWEEYNKLSDRVPLKFEEKDFLLIKFTNITHDEGINSGSLYDQFKDIAGSSLSIAVPGIIRESSATTRDDSSVAWNISDNPVLHLNVVIFDGIILGIIFFALAAIVIFLVFLNRVKKVNQLIAEEYSLERAAEMFAKGETEEEEKP